MILNCFEESPRDCFNFVFSDERSTYTHSIYEIESASIITNLQIKYGCFLNYHYRTIILDPF